MKKENIVGLIGKTPLVRISEEKNIYVKLEYLNPSGSVKDRVARKILLDAIDSGELRPGMEIVEATSGNMGISISLVGKRLGYDVTIIMPENMSDERKAMIRNLGANLILTPATESIGGAVDYLNKNYVGKDNIFLPDQFRNKSNIKAHYEGTAAEIYEQMDGKVDVFISGIGSGGTISGVAKYLKEKNRDVKIIAVEPKGGSALLGDGPVEHAIQGIGDGFIPEILDRDLIDEIITITDENALSKTKELSREYGLMGGISSGANIYVAEYVAEKYGKDLNILTLLPDRMERYMSVL